MGTDMVVMMLLLVSCVAAPFVYLLWTIASARSVDLRRDPIHQRTREGSSDLGSTRGKGLR